ncbi:MAG: carboxypeptidase regulatory-like domain-containing protein [Bryobacteraceae bacterium]
MRLIMLMLVVLLAAALPTVAQTFGEITGVVSDSSGALIPGATATVTNKATNASRTTTSNESGVYSFPSLLPGVYDIKVTRDGFRSVSRTDITLEVQQTARLDFALQLGQVSEVIEVTGGAPLLATENATVGTVVENKRIVELPLNGRNFLQLVALAPNMNLGFAVTGDANGRQGGQRAAQVISIGGQRTSFNRFTLDGMENTDVNFNTYVVLPSIDALQEFKVQTGIYPAEFGRNVGQVNVSTKGGGNQFHGALFEFLRNSSLDAKPYAFTAARPPKVPFRWNQYGFTLGGPILIPKLFNGRNRLFFMSNFEGFRERRQLQSVFNTPTTNLRGGDLSSLPQRVFDPLTRVREGNALVAQPFTGNIIPANRIHPLSKQFYEFIPEANINTTSQANNLLVAQNRPSDRDQFLQRVDFVENSNSNWFGRYSRSEDNQITPNIKFNGTTVFNRVHQAMISNTRVLTPTLVNDFRFGYNKFFNTIGPELAFIRDVVGEYKIQGLPSPDASAWGPMGVAIAGYSVFGGQPGVFTNFNHQFQWVDTVSWTRGTHTFRFGTEIRRDRFNQIGNQFLNGNFNFDPLATVNPASPAGTGVGIGDYLLGYTRQFQAALVPANAQYRATSMYFFFDDTWKIRPNLTLSLGLRYENTPPWYDRTGTMMNLSVPDWALGQSGITDPARRPTVIRAGSGDFYQNSLIRFDPSIQVARDGRLGPYLIRRDNNDFAPRLGIAWTPTSKWTVRTGAGIFYAQDIGNARFDISRNIAGRRQEIANPDVPNLTFDRPVAVLGSTVSIATPTVFSSEYRRRTPYVMEYMLNIQRELSANTLIEIGYLGSVSRKLEFLVFRNKAVPAPLGAGSVQSRRPFPELGATHFASSDGNANYNALSFKFQRRFSSGLTYLASYTWSRAIDMLSGVRTNSNDGTFPQNDACRACERGLSTFHTPHRVVGSAVWELPFGKGRPFLNGGGISDALLGGWQVSSILTLQAGSPFTFRAGRDIANTGRDDDRPLSTGVNAKLPGGQADPQRWFDTRQFALAPIGTFGNVGRSTGVSAGIISWDFSTVKNIRLWESHSLQFRFEAFNFGNHPNWGFPDSIFTSGSFGRITSTRTDMRSLQFALKYLF